MWPPDLDALKADMRSRGEPDGQLDDDNVRLQQVLDAAVAFVERVRSGDYNFAGDPDSELPDPGKDAQLVLGTLRLARRWHERRRSPDGLVDMGELGSSRIPSVDPDIERLLGIGRFRGPVFA